ncbi:MAG: YCF48-related protein [Nibricoccus sp.]
MKRFLSFSTVLLLTLRVHAAEPAATANGLLLDAAVVQKNIFAVGERGRILRSSDSGQTWTTLVSPAHATLTGVSFADEQHGWIVGHDGTILHTADGGATWIQQLNDPKLSFLDVLALDAKRVWAVGSFGTFYATNDGGNTWTPHKVLAEDLHLNAIAASGSDAVFLAGERGSLLRASRTEPTFIATPADYDGSFFGTLDLGRAVLAFGLRGHVFRSEDRGATWQPIPLATPSLILAAIKLKNGAIVLAGQARAFFVSKDEGRTFTAWNPGLTTAVAALLETPDGALLAFGEAGATRLPKPE